MNKTPARRAKYPSARAGDSMYQRAFHATQATLISTAGNGKIIAANKAAARMLGYSNKILLTRTRASLFIIKGNHSREMMNHQPELSL